MEGVFLDTAHSRWSAVWRTYNQHQATQTVIVRDTEHKQCLPPHVDTVAQPRSPWPALTDVGASARCPREQQPGEF